MRRTLGLLLGVALLATACGSSDDSSTTTATEAPTTSEAETTTTTAAETTTTAAAEETTTTTTAAAAAADITIVDFAYGDPLTVAVGTEVTATNEDSVPHTWTASDGTFDSGNLAEGESFSFTFDAAGTYDFTCTIHPTMTGSITVTDDAGAAAPALGPAELTADAQTSDGSTITVASVTLPADGFIAVHADGGGSPGAVIGHSELLPAGTSTDVVVTLDEPLSESSTLFPMVHIDVDQDGVYTFNPPDEAIDVPGQFADGSVAVIPVEVTVG